MKQINTKDFASLREKALHSNKLSPKQKEQFIGIIEGRLIAPLTSDVMSKRLFSPDIHPERFDFIMQRVMNNPNIISNGSAANELPIEFNGAKKTIFDLPAWLTDERLSNLEIQATAQEYIFNRADIYTSRMLMLQYSVDESQRKDEINYNNVGGVVLVALMKDSPMLFKNFDSPRYIHRFTNSVSDTGLVIPSLRQIAFVQLDKALAQLLSKSYNEDEDIELLSMLALLADPNNEAVKAKMNELDFLKDIYNEATLFSHDEEVQNMLFTEELAIADWNSNTKYAEKCGEKRGIAIGEKRGIAIGEKRGIAIGEERTNNLYAWLSSNNRDADLKRAFTDPEFRNQLFAEYDQTMQ